MKKILPLCVKPYVTSECWTYYKFAILQTVTTYKDWVMKYMDVCTDENGYSVFGTPEERFTLSYYNEILDFKDGAILSHSGDAIIKYLIELINANKYVLVDLNYSRIAECEEDFYLHETLIYGYNEEKRCFYSPILEKGVFTEKTIEYKTLIKAYMEAVNYYLDDKHRLFSRRNWFYGITVISPRDYNPSENRFFEFLNKIRKERVGGKYQKDVLNRDLIITGTQVYYTGLISLMILRRAFLRAYEDQEFLRARTSHLQMSLLKIYEHQNLISLSMKNFIDSLEFRMYLEETVKEYMLCCKEMYALYLMFQKFCCSSDKKVLNIIAEKLTSIYERENGILKEFECVATEKYTEKLYL